MKLTHQAAEQLINAIVAKANRDNNDIISKNGYSWFSDVTPCLIRLGILERSYWHESGEPIINENLFEKYVSIIKETIPVYTNALKIVDYYIGGFECHGYNPEKKKYELYDTRSRGVGIIEILVQDGITIKD